MKNWLDLQWLDGRLAFTWNDSCTIKKPFRYFTKRASSRRIYTSHLYVGLNRIHKENAFVVLFSSLMKYHQDWLHHIAISHSFTFVFWKISKPHGFYKRNYFVYLIYAIDAALTTMNLYLTVGVKHRTLFQHLQSEASLLVPRNTHIFACRFPRARRKAIHDGDWEEYFSSWLSYFFF